jgi:branched-chain amino acid transport system permease protein
MTSIPRTVAMLLIALVVLLALFPTLGGFIFPAKHAFIMQKLAGIMILAMMAMSLDLLVGVTGLVSLGHAAFFGLGGYALAILSPEYEAANIWLVLPAALAIVAAAALLVGFLSIRTSGIYFIMVTLAFGQMGYYLLNDSRAAGGSDGLSIMETPAIEIAGRTLLKLADSDSFYYLVLALFVGTYALLRMVLNSPFGHVVRAIGVNENRVRGLGFDPVRYKLAAFTLGCTLAGLAGFLAAAQYGYVNPTMLSWHHSGEALMMVILGGMGTLFGPAIGAFVFELARFGFESTTDHWQLLMGGLVVTIVLVLPRGLAGLLLDLAGRGGKQP